jgi:hypothetical protein
VAAFLIAVGAPTGILVTGTERLQGASPGASAQSVESSGDLAGARAILEEQAKSGHPEARAALAEFLSRHNSPDQRTAFAEWASNEQDPQKRRMALRQITLLDFQEGNTKALDADLQQYRAAGGTELTAPIAPKAANKVYGLTSIPGPLHSFARMAALSPDLAPQDLLPALARNVVTNGYQAIASNESLDQTEYLRLVIRYLAQARELSAMAGTDHKIVVPNCDSEQTGDLLRILGYRMRGSCGGDVVLETVNPSKAFLTIDSAFPLSELEQDLRANRKFELAYAPTPIPVLYGPSYWVSALSSKGNGTDLIGEFLNDPSLCRLYLGLSKLDSRTAEAMRKKIPVSQLKLYAPVLDFFGSMFEIKGEVASVPGSPEAWARLAGVSPSKGAEFYRKLIETDDGWLASYFDALARIDSPATAYLLQPERMRRFYEAIRGKVTTPGPARPVFRSSTDLLLLTTSLRLDADGQPHIPGGVLVWKNLFIKHPRGKYDSKLSKSAAAWKAPDDVLEALFALCRKSVENEPLRIFLALNDVDRNRTHPISPELAKRLTVMWRSAGAQYSLLADSPSLSEASINMFLDSVSGSAEIRDTLTRADSIGSEQALIGLWGILCRQGAIPVSRQDESFSALLSPFLKARQPAEVFDADRSGIQVLLTAAHAPNTGLAQDRLVDLLVGRPRVNSDRTGPAENFLRVLDAQRLIPLDQIYAIADAFTSGTGIKKALAPVENALLRFEETQSLRNSLSSEERNLLSLGYWSERHISQERKLDFEELAKTVPEKKEVRGKLTPFVRDTLVGMLYAYYSPPGAQLIFANPLFVRNHDFIGAQGMPMAWRQTEIVGNGWPASAGGRLMGSLISLPYAMAEAEQNFLTPTREQALIWGDLVPQIMVDVTVSRWQHVKPQQIRWVALHLRRGEDLLAESALDANVGAKVMRSLSRFANPARLERIQEHLSASDYAGARAQVLPSELYALSTDAALADAPADVASLEIATLRASDDPALSSAAIGATFGTPKPTLTHSYRPCLLYLPTFPTLMGYSSRLLAETWESNGFYYAGLADELGVPADQLDVYVPKWTEATIENIFATHLEDWPALLRSLRAVGQNARRQSGAEQARLRDVNQSSN